MTTTPTLAATIRAARDGAGLTQSALALAVGVQVTTISRWETGRQEPTTEYLELIAAACGRTLRIEMITPSRKVP